MKNVFTEKDKDTARRWLLDMLKKEKIQINFIKKDGTERTMNCTLMESVVPAYEKKTERIPSSESCFVYDLDKKEWRSFRYDSIKSVTISLL